MANSPGNSGPPDESRRPSSPPEAQHPPQPLELGENSRSSSTNYSVESPSRILVDMDAASSSSRVGITISESSHDTRGVSCKLLQTVASAVAAACVVLFVNVPPRPEPDRPTVVYNAHVAFIWLALCASLVLFFYSILMPIERRVAWVQERMMMIAVAFVLLALVLHTFLVLTVASFWNTWLFFFFGAGGVGLYLAVAWKRRAPTNPIHGGSNGR